MKPIRAIAELPFARRDALALLNLDRHRDEPDADYAGFGWSRVDTIRLEGGSAAQRLVRDALLVAVHSADEPEALADDIELEFLLPEVGTDYSVTVLLSTFLEVWLPRLRGDEQAIVLVVCNPHRARVRGLAGVPLHYPLGDVESWRDLDDGCVSLVAEAWHTAEAP